MDDSQHQRAIAAFADAIRVAGSQTAIAKICECTPGAISQLVIRSRPLSARFVLKVEAATGISRHELRPDIYPLELTSGAPVPASAGEPLPVGRTPACPSAGSDPEPADTTSHGETAGSGEAAGAMDCDPMAPAADSPPIGKAAA
ncbi:MAG: transcriptional regulator [Pseudomonadota bacterium]